MMRLDAKVPINLKLHLPDPVLDALQVLILFKGLIKSHNVTEASE
jgi:hypothetical protein